MGFDELSQTSLRNNRSLLRGTINKYFRSGKGFPVNEKTELSVRRRKNADTKRRARTNIFFLLLVLGFVLMITCFLFIL